MSEKDIKFDNWIKALCPPFIYFFITLIVQAVTDVIIFFRQGNSIKNKGNASFLDSYEFMENVNSNLDKYSYLITFIAAGIAVILFGYIYFRVSNEYESGGFRNQFTKLNFNSIALIVLLGLFGSLGLSRFVSMLPLDNIIGNYSETGNSLMSGSFGLQIISLAIVVPVAEELIYRGLVFIGLTKIMDAKYAIIVTSIVFACFHFNLLQGIYTFLFSLLLVCIYMRYKTLLAPIIVHGTANFIAVIFTHFGISEFFNRNIWIYLLVMTGELIVGIVIFQMIMSGEKK